MKGTHVIFLSLIVLIAVTAGCSPGPPPEPTATPVPTVHPGKSIVGNNCIACHDLGRVNNYKTDRQGWELIVDRMILTGAKLSDEQRVLAIDYLALTLPRE